MVGEPLESYRARKAREQELFPELEHSTPKQVFKVERRFRARGEQPTSVGMEVENAIVSEFRRREREFQAGGPPTPSQARFLLTGKRSISPIRAALAPFRLALESDERGRQAGLGFFTGGSLRESMERAERGLRGEEQFRGEDVGFVRYLPEGSWPRKLAGRFVEEAVDPANIFIAAKGAKFALGTAELLGGRAGRVAASFVRPIATGPLPKRLAAEAAASGLFRLGAEQEEKLVPEDAPEGVRFGVGLATGLAAVLTGTAAQRRGQRVLRSATKEEEEQALRRAAGPLESSSPGILSRPDRSFRLSKDPRIISQATPRSSTFERLFAIQDVEEKLSRADRFKNLGIATMQRFGSTKSKLNPQLTPILRSYQATYPKIDAQANIVGQKALVLVKQSFKLSSDGVSVPALTGIDPELVVGKVALTPTVADVAARLPRFAPSLTKAQLNALEQLRKMIEPWAMMYGEMGIDLEKRADVMPGGFYIPRGRAAIKGFGATIATRSRFKVEFKTSAEYLAHLSSQAAGIALKPHPVVYEPVWDALESYAREAGIRANNARLGNFLRGLVDEAGRPIGKTAVDRQNPELRNRVFALRARLAQRRKTFLGRSARSSTLEREATRREGELRGTEEMQQRAAGRAASRTQNLRDAMREAHAAAEDERVLRAAERKAADAGVSAARAGGSATAQAREAARAKQAWMSAEKRAILAEQRWSRHKAIIQSFDISSPKAVLDSLPSTASMKAKAERLRRKIWSKQTGAPAAAAAKVPTAPAAPPPAAAAAEVSTAPAAPSPAAAAKRASARKTAGPTEEIRMAMRMLGETLALTDIRRAAETAGTDLNRMLTEIEAVADQAIAEEGDFFAQRLRVISEGRLKELQPAVAAYQNLIMNAIGASDLEVVARSSTERMIEGAEREMRLVRAEANRAAKFADSAETRAGISGERAAQAETRAANLRKEIEELTAARIKNPTASKMAQIIARAAAAERELAMLTRQVGVERTRSSRAAGGYWKARARSDKTSAEINSMQEELTAIKSDYDQMKKMAEAIPFGQSLIDLPLELSGRAFPNEIANYVNEVLRKSNRKAATGQGSEVINAVYAFNKMFLAINTTGDNSAPGIQGLLGLGDDQRAWGTALKINAQAWLREEALGAFLVDFDEVAPRAGRLDSAGWASWGMRIDRVDPEYALGGGSGAISERVGRFPYIKQANRAWATFGTVLRLKWADDLLETELNSGRTLMEIEASGDMKRIAEIANNMTGAALNRFGGALGDVLLLAPRFLQARLLTVGKAALSMRPDAPIDQRLARRAMLKLIAFGVILTEGLNEILGNDTDHRPIVDGKYNSNFMRIRALGRDWTVFGTYDSLLRAIVLTASGKPHDAARGMGSGIVSMLWDFISDETYAGEDVRSDPVTFASWLLDSFSPIVAGEGLESLTGAVGGAVHGDLQEVAAGSAGLIGEMFGVKSSPETAQEVAARGGYESLVGEQQFKATSAEAWRVVGEQKKFAEETRGYSSFSAWYNHTQKELIKQLRQAGMSRAEAEVKADSAMPKHPVFRAYVELRNILRTQWVKQFPEDALRIWEREAERPRKDQRWTPTKEQREIMLSYQKALAAYQKAPAADQKAPAAPITGE